MRRPEGTVWQWLEQHTALLGWMFLLSLVSLVLCAILLPIVVCRLPSDYFAVHRSDPAVWRSPLTWVVRIAKNLAGLVFLLAGFVMLFLPGQGLLTMLIGLLLLDFPGKRGLERRFVRRPGIRAALDRLRARHGRPPLQLD